MNWTLDKPYSCSSGAPSLITNRPSDTSTMKARGEWPLDLGVLEAPAPVRAYGHLQAWQPGAH